MDGRTILVTNQPIAERRLGRPAGGHHREAARRAEDHLARPPRRPHRDRQPLSFRRAARAAHLGDLEPDDGFAVLWLDLDKFKDVNDTFGHPMGDMLLKSVAHRLRETLRSPDLIGRLGGDEFAILQRNAKRKGDAEGLATRLLRSVSEPHHVAGHTLQIGASIGIVHVPEDGSTHRRPIQERRHCPLQGQGARRRMLCTSSSPERMRNSESATSSRPTQARARPPGAGAALSAHHQREDQRGHELRGVDALVPSAARA